MNNLPFRSRKFARVARVAAIATVAFLVGSCVDLSVPTRVSVPDNSKKSLVITDWYSCWRYESSTTWQGCEYISSTSTYIAGWADFDLHAPQPTSLMQVKVTNSECPECDDPNQASAPHLYIPMPDADDMLQRSARPDCRYAQRDPRDKAWCDAKVPQYSRKDRLKAAIDRMMKLGGVCADLATIGQTLWSEGAIRVYDPNPNGTGYQGGGFAPVNLGTRGYILLHKNSTDAFWQDSTYSVQTTRLPDGTTVTFKVNLQFSLAHELDHLTSPDDHLDPKSQGGQGWLTPHAIQCSGLKYP